MATEQQRREAITGAMASMIEWMELRIVIPADEGKNLLEFLKKEYAFDQLDEDWTVEKRKHDNAYCSYAPSESPPNLKENW